VDAKGVVKPAGVTSLTANGKAIASFVTTNGTLTIKDDEKYIGSKVTVLAVKGDLTATTELTVVDTAEGVVYTTTEVAVGANNTLKANVFDANGKFVAQSGTPQVIVIDKPEGAVATVNGATLANGRLSVNFLASAAGEYKLQTIITTADGKYISGIETITVGGANAAFNDVVVVSMGANSMIVNNKVVALDVAPYITEGRTMLQFNVLGAFGIDVQWDEATRSVIAEGNGTKVVLTIDSKVAVVNGQEVALDVAPTIVNGRTVVPVGFITGNFGINPTFTYNADGTIADILFTK
jgi:hypothetical protein